jgi:hypothetical protein
VADVIAIDPGYKRSAFVRFDGTTVLDHAILDNADLLSWIDDVKEPGRVMVLESMQLFSSSHGVGQEVFDSVFWSGRFAERWQPGRFDRLLRSKVRAHLRASRGGDSAVRQSLIERFGPYKEEAIGIKKKPGPLYGIKADEWSALAIACVWWDLNAQKPEEVRPGVAAQF